MRNSTFKTPTYAEALAKKKEAQKRAISRKKQRDATKPKKAPKKHTQANTAPRKRKRKTELQKLKDKLWQHCRRIIKKRYPHVCYTCGKSLIDGSADFHTGHFIPSSVCSTEMRYSLDNLRPQCSGCNVWKSGNWIEFQKHLKQEMGDAFPDELIERNELTKGIKYDSLWYKEAIEEYEKY